MWSKITFYCADLLYTLFFNKNMKSWADITVLSCQIFGRDSLFLHVSRYLFNQLFHPRPPSTCACPPRAFGATAFVGTLVCHRWNSCGWQVPGRQQQTGAEHAWLTDASAYSLRGREGREQGPLLHHNSLTPPILLRLMLAHYVLLCFFCCHLLPSEASVSVAASWALISS